MRKQTGDVLASARSDLQAQLSVVRDELGRLTAEERTLTHALSSLDGDGSSSRPVAPARSRASRTRTAKGQARKGSTRKAATTRRRAASRASKSTADRVKDLQALLVDGPKSRGDLAAALEVSPPRVQQLLAELGSSVSSQPDPAQRQGKLWSLKGSGGGAGATKPAAGRAGNAKDGSARTPSARRKSATK